MSFSLRTGILASSLILTSNAFAFTCPALTEEERVCEEKLAATLINLPLDELHSRLAPVKVYSAGYDGTKYLGKYEPSLNFGNPAPGAQAVPTFDLDPNKKFQKMRGFGASLTEACSISLMKMPQNERRALLEKIFSVEKGAGMNIMRMPIGASDFADSKRGSYTYADKKDPSFRNFDMSRDSNAFALLREAKEINPELEIMITPWTAPPWMKTSGAYNAGELKPEHYQDFANYFVKTIEGYRAEGLDVATLTIQNEPFYSTTSYPSMAMSEDHQKKFIGEHLGPTLEAKGMGNVKILGLDHNWDISDAAHNMLDDPKAGKHLHGIAYHCYGGSRWAMSETVKKYPNKEVIQTECTGSGLMENGNPTGDFHWWLENHSVAAVAQGTTGTLGWNLCLDHEFGPTNGGCSNCRGMVTIDTSKENTPATLNPEFQAVAQVSKFVRKNAVRVGLDGGADGINAVAFKNPDGSKVFVAQNTHDQPMKFRVRTPDCRSVEYEVAAKGAVTFSW